MGHRTINGALATSLIFFSIFCWADLDHRVSIFQVRKSIPLSDGEPVYRDFYISSGDESGIRVGMIIPVKRRVPVHDPVSNKLAGDIYVNVGELKIIHVGKGLSVGRELSTVSDRERPILDYGGFLVGNRIDIDQARYPEENFSEPLMVPEKEMVTLPAMKQVQKKQELPPRPEKEDPPASPRDGKQEAKAPGPLLL